MQFHGKKRVELIIERALLTSVLDALADLDATGYSVLPLLAGHGHAGRWEEGVPGDPLRMVMVVCITAPERVDPLLERLMPLLDRYAGIVTVGDVAVVRADHF